jgi:Flp pilus assembly protein TadB
VWRRSATDMKTQSLRARLCQLTAASVPSLGALRLLALLVLGALHLLALLVLGALRLLALLVLGALSLLALLVLNASRRQRACRH